MIKSLLITIAFVLSSSAFSQNFVQSNILYPTCFNACNGSVVFSTTTTAGPFTAVLSNSTSCPNSTVQSSTGNSITLNNLCECAGTYSVSFFNSSMVLVGFELLQVPVTATSALVLNTPTVNPATCGSCCNGSVHIGWSGGYTPPPNGPTITIDGSDISSSYFPNPTVCVGNHTVCVADMAGCQVCTTFSMNYVAHVGIRNVDKQSFKLQLSPNPAENLVSLTAEFIEKPQSVRFLDLNGRSVLEVTQLPESLNKYPIDISVLAKGIYIVELANLNKTIFRQKLIKISQ